MVKILVSAAVGYVLGARAGRQRYDEIVRAYHRVLDHPAVQGTAGVVRAKLGEKVRRTGKGSAQVGWKTSEFDHQDAWTG